MIPSSCNATSTPQFLQCAEQDWDDKFVVLFAGNVGMSQGLDTVLEAAGLLRDTPNLLFVIVGNGASKPALLAQAEKMKLPNVRVSALSGL